MGRQIHHFFANLGEVENMHFWATPILSMEKMSNFAWEWGKDINEDIEMCGNMAFVGLECLH